MSRTDLVVVLGETYYAIERPWGILPSGFRFEFVSDVAVNSRDEVYVFQRIYPKVVVFSSSGDYLRSWGSIEPVDSHHAFIDASDRVWIADRDAHEVVCWDQDGRKLLVLGERHRPKLDAPFNHPTDIAGAPNGDIFVSDGYANSSVHRFGSDGRWITSWGGRGSGPGEFTTPHGIWVDFEGRVVVADRENNRVQFFTQEGTYLYEWRDLYKPMAIYGDKQERLFVTDQIPRLSMFGSDGKLSGRCRPVLAFAHGIAGDSHGDFYLAESSPHDQITKLARLSD